MLQAIKRKLYFNSFFLGSVQYPLNIFVIDAIINVAIILGIIIFATAIIPILNHYHQYH